MLDRRSLLAAAPALLAGPAFAQAPQAPSRISTPEEAASFARYIAGVKEDARKKGISPEVLDRAFAGVHIAWRVIELDRNQPEVKLTWEQYRTRIVSEQRILRGREQLAKHRDLLLRVQDRFGVPPAIIIGLWGLESDYGRQMGGFNVVEAVATLAWEGRRASFFRGELIAALRILDAGDVTPGRMTGSYAGAMGQPQFMPSSYLRYAVDFEGNGRRDIWTSVPDVLGSIANYLARSGWRAGECWGQPAIVPAGFDEYRAGRDNRLPLSEWTRLGVRPLGGRLAAPPNAQAAVLLPDGTGGEAFLAYGNFAAIRRYNPSDLYAIAIGLLGDQVVT